MEKYHVTKHSDGSWQVLLGTGSKKAIKKFKTQAEALAYAQELAEKRNSTVYLHGKNGRVRDTASYKELDPNVPKRGRPRKAKEEPQEVKEEVTTEPVEVKEEVVAEAKEEKVETKEVVKKEVKKPEVKKSEVKKTEVKKPEVKAEPKEVKAEPKEEKKVEVKEEKKVEEVNIKETPKKKSKTWLYVLLTVILLLVVGFAVYYFGFYNK